MMKSVRAAGVAFFLVAMVICVWAAFGVDRLLEGKVSRAGLWWPLGLLGGFALLGAGGLLQPVTEALASQQMMQAALGNADALRLGGVRLLLVLLVGGGVMLAIRAGKLRGMAAAAALVVVVAGDNWTILKHFATWLPPASVTYANDQIIDAVQRDSLPYRVYDPSGSQAGAGVYQGSVLMAHEVPTLFGYHGMESKYFDALLGGKNDWQNQLSPTLWDLYGVEFITLNQDVPAIPGFHKVLGPVSFPNTVDRTPAGVGYLWQRDSSARWVRVVPGAVKVAEEKIVATVSDPNYPVDAVALFPDTAEIAGASTTAAIPDPTTVTARLTHWEPGRMTVALDGSDTRTTYLLVAENWYPDWRATIDGQPVATYRANFAMLGVALPPGAKEVQLTFDMASYHTGRLITLLCLLGALALIGAGWWRIRSTDG